MVEEGLVADQAAKLYTLSNRGLYALYQRDAGAYLILVMNIARELSRRGYALALLARIARGVQPEADVFGHRLVREQRIALKDGVDRPLERRKHRNVFAV